MANCPKCDATIHRVTTSELTTTYGGTISRPTKWRVLAYACPKCEAILSVAIDPIALARQASLRQP